MRGCCSGSREIDRWRKRGGSAAVEIDRTVSVSLTNVSVVSTVALDSFFSECCL